MKRPAAVVTVLFALVFGCFILRVAAAGHPAPSPGQQSAYAQQYPIMDKIADKVIQKYQQSTCEQLYQEKAQHSGKPKSAEEQRVIGILRNDAEMRAAFINKVAPPIAGKMFDCGMIP